MRKKQYHELSEETQRGICRMYERGMSAKDIALRSNLQLKAVYMVLNENDYDITRVYKEQLNPGRYRLGRITPENAQYGMPARMEGDK